MLRILLLCLAVLSTPAWSQSREAVDPSNEPKSAAAAAPLTPMNELYPKFRDCAAGLLSLYKTPHKETDPDQIVWIDYLLSNGVYGGKVKDKVRTDYTADGIKTGSSSYYDGNIRRNPWTTVRPNIVRYFMGFDAKNPSSTLLYKGPNHVSNDSAIRKALEDFDENLAIDMKQRTHKNPQNAFDARDFAVIKTVGCKCSLYIKARKGTNGIDELNAVFENFKNSYIGKQMVETGSRLRSFETQDFECLSHTS